jgi:hypothetical protein
VMRERVVPSVPEHRNALTAIYKAEGKGTSCSPTSGISGVSGLSAV